MREQLLGAFVVALAVVSLCRQAVYIKNAYKQLIAFEKLFHNSF